MFQGTTPHQHLDLNKYDKYMWISGCCSGTDIHFRAICWSSFLLVTHDNTMSLKGYLSRFVILLFVHHDGDSLLIMLSPSVISTCFKRKERTNGGFDRVKEQDSVASVTPIVKTNQTTTYRLSAITMMSHRHDNNVRDSIVSSYFHGNCLRMKWWLN